MATPAPESESEPESASEESTATVTAHATAPEKTVFVESGNHDAWIATDLVVDLER